MKLSLAILFLATLATCRPEPVNPKVYLCGSEMDALVQAEKHCQAIGGLCSMALGLSMFPIIHNGDMLVIDRMPYGENLLGKVALLKVGEVFVSHRVDVLNDNAFLTEGDNNGWTEWQNKQNYIGEVVGIYRVKGKL